MRLLSTLIALTLFLPAIATAQEGRYTIGGDQFAAGQVATVDAPVERDAFLAGYDVSLRAPVAGDAHLGGFNVLPAANVGGDLYAAGFTVTVTGNVGGDLTAAGNSVSISTPAPVGGNLRIAGQTVNIASEVTGAALVAAQTATLGAAVKGDMSFVGENLNFGPNARVDGRLTIRAPREIAVPATVATADRVTFELMSGPDYVSEAGRTAEHVVRGIWPAMWATGLWWLLLFVIGTLFITLGPRLVEALRVAASTRPFRRLGLGVIALAAVIGVVPVLFLTVIGIFVVPVALVLVFLAWLLGYLAGVYLLGARVAETLTPLDSVVKRLAVLAISILALGLLGMIPVVGWLITLIILCFGLGAIATHLLGRRPDTPQAVPAPQAV